VETDCRQRLEKDRRLFAVSVRDQWRWKHEFADTTLRYVQWAIASPVETRLKPTTICHPEMDAH